MLASAIHLIRITLRRPGFYGDFGSLDAAARATRGYNIPEIARAFAAVPDEDVSAAITVRGQQLLAALAATKADRLRILDVGGANGAYYFMLKARAYRHIPSFLPCLVLRANPLRMRNRAHRQRHHAMANPRGLPYLDGHRVIYHGMLIERHMA